MTDPNGKNRMSLSDVLRGCESHLLASEEADVPLAWRVRLWDCMNVAFPVDAMLRKSVLAYVVASQTLPAWQAVANRVEDRLVEVPSTLIKNCRRLILAEIDRSKAQPFHVQDDIEYAMSLLESVGPAAWSILAAYASINCASGHEEAVYEEFLYDHIWDEDFLIKCREEDDDWENSVVPVLPDWSG